MLGFLKSLFVTVGSKAFANVVEQSTDKFLNDDLNADQKFVLMRSMLETHQAGRVARRFIAMSTIFVFSITVIMLLSTFGYDILIQHSVNNIDSDGFIFSRELVTLLREVGLLNNVSIIIGFYFIAPKLRK